MLQKYTKEDFIGKDLLCHQEGFMERTPWSFLSKGKRYKITVLKKGYLMFTVRSALEHLCRYENVHKHFTPVYKKKNSVKRKRENWKLKISKSKFERCLENCTVLRTQKGEVFYNSVENVSYRIETDVNGKTIYVKYRIEKVPHSLKEAFNYAALYMDKMMCIEECNMMSKEVMTTPEVVEDICKSGWTDKHYDFNYKLTDEDIERGFIKLDPYFVGKEWKIGSKDDSGALSHCLKTVARFGEKNSVEREIRALHAQIKRMAELYNVDLEDK